MERDVLETGINREYVEEARGASSPLGQPRTLIETPEVPEIPQPRFSKTEPVDKPVQSDRLIGVLQPVPTTVGSLHQNYQYNAPVFSANARQWGTTKLLNALDWNYVADRESRFGADDPDFNIQTGLKERGFSVTEREFDVLLRLKPRNDKELDYLIDNLKRDKEDYQVMGQHPWKSFGYGSLDPVYIGVGAGIGGAARMVNAGRLAGAVAGGTADAAISGVEYQYNPELTGGDIAANFILGTAGGFIFGGSKPKTHKAKVDTDESVEVPTEVRRMGKDTWEVDIVPEITVEQQYAGLVEQLQANVGGYHQGDSPTFTMKDGKFVQLDDNTFEIPYSQPTYVTYGKSKTTLDVNGQARELPYKEYGVDSVQAYTDRTQIHGEMKTWRSSPKPEISGWTFIKRKDWKLDADESGLPKYSDIDWNHKTESGMTLKSTAFNKVYRLIDSPKVPQALKAIARSMIIQGGDYLMTVRATISRNKASMQSRRTFGWYNPRTNKMHVRAYEDAPASYAQHTITHEAMHALTYPKIEYAKANPNSAHGRIVREVQELIDFVQDKIANDAKTAKWFNSLDKSQRFAIDYALSSPHEFFSALAELSHDKLKAFRKMLDETKLPDHLKSKDTINTGSVLQYLANALRKLLGLDIKQGNALFKALELGNDILESPTITMRDFDGKLRSVEVMNPDVKGKIMKATIEEAEGDLNRGIFAKLGYKLAWNAYKTIKKFNPELAHKLLNDPLGTNPGNVQQIRQAIRTHWIDKYRTVWEEKVRQAIKRDGVKAYDYYARPAKVREAQDALAIEVAEGLVHMEAGKYNPAKYSKDAQEIIEVMDNFTKEAARDLVDAGLLPPEVLQGKGGYFPRKWNGHYIADLRKELADAHFQGDEGAALDYLTQQFAGSIRIEGVTDKARMIYARAMLQRALAKADNTDLIYRGHLGMETAYEVRRMLENQKVDPSEIQRIMDVVTGKIEEAGKDSWQKGRMDIDMTHQMALPDGSVISVHDLMDKRNLLQNMARYLEDTSGRIALARKGIKTTADIANTKREMVESMIKGGMTKSHAEQLTEDIFNATLGRPVGEVMHTWGRIIAGMTQMMALRNSGFWQVTELAKATMHSLMTQGALNTIKFLGQAFGEYRKINDPQVARQLHHVLARKSYNEVRLRPYVDMFEDNHAIKSNRLSAFQHGVSSVYHINGMAAVQRLQASYSARILTANLEDAVNGNTKLANYLKRYGMTDEMLARVGKEIDKHGLNIDEWNYKVWQEVDPILTAIMDTDVLRSNTGDVPVFFQFSTVGKILGTFQNFTLTSHNKIMANTMVNDGAKGFAMLMAIQIPLTMLMTQVSSVSGGRGFIEDPYEWAIESASQAGGFGLFSMAFNAMKGNSSVGGAMMISLDKTQDILAKTLTGDFAGALDTAAKNVPLISLMPGWGLAIETLKGED